MIQIHFLLLISSFHYRVHMPVFALIIIRKTTIHRTIKKINETREKSRSLEPEFLKKKMLNDSFVVTSHHQETDG